MAMPKDIQDNEENGKDMRTCLRCDREFESDGIYNRICPNCKNSNANISPYAEGVSSPADVRTKPKAIHPHKKTKNKS